MSAVVGSIAGKWTEASIENFEAFMKELEVSYVMRKVASTTRANEEWIVDDDVIIVKFTSTFKNKTLTFKLGLEFDEETLDGRKVKTTITEEEGKLVTKQSGKPRDVCVIRELDGDMLKATMACNGVTAVRKYRRV